MLYTWKEEVLRVGFKKINKKNIYLLFCLFVLYAQWNELTMHNQQLPILNLKHLDIFFAKKYMNTAKI